MTSNAFLVSTLEGKARPWSYDAVYRLASGSSWKLETTDEARLYNSNASFNESKRSKPIDNPKARVFRTMDNFFLEVDSMGRQRQVVPDHVAHGGRSSTIMPRPNSKPIVWDDELPKPRLCPYSRICKMPEHRCSSVFPRIDYGSLDRVARMLCNYHQPEPIVIANGWIVLRGYLLDGLRVADMMPLVLDLGEMSRSTVRRYVSTINSVCQDYDPEIKRQAAKRLTELSKSQLTYADAAKICGLPNSDASITALSAAR